MASSVAEPEVPTESNGARSTNGLKRRQSDASEQEQESKRQRTSPGKSSPQPTTTTEEHPAKEPEEDTKTPEKAADTREARRKSGVPDEKQRSKRLFGALLGNLNRPSDRASKRRAEIEERKKAELQKQDDERLEDRQRRLEKLAVQRKREQINVDEQKMRTRHENMLNAANFLQTKAEPKIYYRPWDLLPDEEDRIDDQISDAKARIDEEVAEWKTEKRRRLEEMGETVPEEQSPTPSKVEDAGSETAAAPATQEKEKEEKTGNDADQEAPEEPAAITEIPDSQEVVPESDAGKEADKDAGEENVPTSAAEAEGTKETDIEKPDVQEETVKEKQEEPPIEVVEEQKQEVEEVEEEADHVVVGDEDTVEY